MSRRAASIVLRSNGGGSVLVAGADISDSVRAVQVDAEPGSARLLVTLDLHGDFLVTPDSDQIRIPDHTRDALLALGWTPPGEEPR